MKRLFLAMTVIPSVILGGIINVPTDYNTIQEAINAAQDFDTVLVEQGRYYENIRFFGKKINVASRFLTTGDNSYILNTIIDGSAPYHPDTASCVRFIDHEDTNSVLCGFTLTGGTGTVWPDVHFGGTLFREGGGIFVDSASPVITGNFIVNNQTQVSTGLQSAGGGGIRIADASPRITGNIIMLNNGRYGAGISEFYSGSIIRNNLIMLNDGGDDYGGSGIWVWGATTDTTLIENNTIVNNTSFQRGGGVRVYASVALVKNCILWGNVSQNGGNPNIYLTSGGRVVAEYNCVENGYTGTGNIGSDPCFADSNKHLTPASPCVDSGDPASPGDPEDSLNPGYALYPSMGSLRADMGAYGGPARIDFPDITFFVGIEENTGKVPANPNDGFKVSFQGQSLSVFFEVTERKFISIKIFRINGSLVEILCERDFEAGNYSFIVDTEEFPSGVYFLTMNGEEAVQSSKFAIVK
ncbi:hypothetical protein JXL83_08750 [candidate division WOR-3 bacterium]|nr:hypothetical protein [candidate division WOR-3 bacterium]